jgi:tRNA(fMet)-specific endonuclease VapC
MRYLLDNDWIIEFLAGKKDAERALQRFDPTEIVISLVTVAEIYESAFHYANPEAHLQRFRTFLDNFELLNLNVPIVEMFAEIRADLRRRGEMISDFDVVIAATALHYDLTLFTYNARHFKRIPHLKLYPLP